MNKVLCVIRIMIESQIDELIDRELKSISYPNSIDVQCFKSHRIKPCLINVCLDCDGINWKDCYLVTEHNGINDSPYRVIFDPEHNMFAREITLQNAVALYLGRYPGLEALLDDFA